MAHEDEAVKPQDEVKSQLVAEAQHRHERAKGDDATDQEKKQAAVEQAHALATRPDGSYAQLHEVTGNPTLAVADSGYKSQLDKDAEEALAANASGEESRPASKSAASARTEKRS